jgi:ribosomal protein S18 acetylase RimI-like enzyme
MTHPQSGVIVALENNKPVGFCAYSEDLSGFYKYLIKKKLPRFAWYAAGAFFRNPKVLFRLLRAFAYSDESKREESYVELSSIGVSPNVKNLGIGSLMIEKLCSLTDANQFEYIKLETDRDNNEAANYFYQKNGFVLDHSYETPEGRRMNEYRYYLGEK